MFFFQVLQANCPGMLAYRHRLNNEPYQNTTSTSVQFYLDGDEPFDFAVQAVNTGGAWSEVYSYNGRSKEIGMLTSTLYRNLVWVTFLNYQLPCYDASAKLREIAKSA